MNVLSQASSFFSDVHRYFAGNHETTLRVLVTGPLMYNPTQCVTSVVPANGKVVTVYEDVATATIYQELQADSLTLFLLYKLRPMEFSAIQLILYVVDGTQPHTWNALPTQITHWRQAYHLSDTVPILVLSCIFPCAHSSRQPLT